jgi:hypothetical protein
MTVCWSGRRSTTSWQFWLSSAALLWDDHRRRTGAGAGSYRLVAQIGFGRMGEVWKRHQMLARTAAIKL